jgi:hypothetical protein
MCVLSLSLSLSLVLVLVHLLLGVALRQLTEVAISLVAAVGALATPQPQ